MNAPTITDQDLSTLFGLDDLSPEEKVELLEEIGSVLFQSTTVRFIAEMDEHDVPAFEAFLATDADEHTLKRLIETYPRFGEILDEEVAAFRSDASAVLS
jgi:hypothetical protein